MRLLLEFTLKDEALPLESRRLAVSYIKHAMKANNPALFDCEYNGASKLKDLVFAMYYPIDSINKKEIMLKGKMMQLRIGTSDLAYGIQLYNMFQEQLNCNYVYKSYEIKLKRIILENEHRIYHEAVRIKMLSPLAIRDKENDMDRYLIPSDSKFCSRFNEIIKAQIEILNVDLNDMHVGITALKTKKVVVKHYGQFIDASIGEFILEGHPTLLNFLYHSGIGSRRSAGFGMFEIL